MAERLHTCKTCEFFEYLPGEEEGNGPLGGMGECHRNAPRAFTTSAVQSSKDTKQSVVWPRILDADWCGEYDRKQETW